MEKEYIYIGKINKDVLGKYKERIITEDVILTYERKEHIMSRHKEVYDEIFDNICEILYSPDYVLEDDKNSETLLIIKALKVNNDNLIVVLKLNTNCDNSNKYNSILTVWKIRDRNLKKQLEKKQIIYSKVLRSNE